MKTLPLFWKTLDELPSAATDTRDWKNRLGEEYDAVARYLKRTGDLAASVDCPSPGGDGCPRRVVRLPGGRFRGVCNSASGGCGPIELTHADVAIAELDLKTLAGDLASALQLLAAEVKTRLQRVAHVGDFAIAAGVSSPVLLALPGLRDVLSEDELRGAGVTIPAVILVPRLGSVPPLLRAQLAAEGSLVLDLVATTCIGADRRLAFVQAPAVLLAPIREALQHRLNDASPVRRIALPPGTKWGQLTLTCTARRKAAVDHA